jgi:hypothetical protein
MANPKDIPVSSRGIDGLSVVPGRAIRLTINWQGLKREFFADPDYMEVKPWLHEVKMWDRGRILNGNTSKATRGWGAQKAAFERRKTEAAIEAMVAIQRKRIPDLLRAKLNLVSRICRDVDYRWASLQAADRKLCYEILKTELGEPTSIKTVGLVSAKDPVEALLEEYGIMKEGRIVIDADEPSEGEIVSEAAGTLDSGPPAEVPPGPAI